MNKRTRLAAAMAAGAASLGLTMGAPLPSVASTANIASSGVYTEVDGDSTSADQRFPGAPPAAAAITAADATTTSQETATAVSYNGWTGVEDSSANGGTYRYNTTTASKVSFQFGGTGFTWLTRKGPDQGIASVSIDRVLVGSVDLYATTGSSFAQDFNGLTAGGHKVVVKVLGAKNAASSGASVVFDGFIVGTTTTQESANTIDYNTWQGAAAPYASGSEYRVSGKAGASVTFSFTGTGVDWITVTGKAWGQADVSIDGVDKGVVDLYAATRKATWQAHESYTGLTAGAHTITIAVLGTLNPAASHTRVAIDAFIVHT